MLPLTLQSLTSKSSISLITYFSVMMYPGIVCLAAILGVLDSTVQSQGIGNYVLTLSKAVSRFSQKLYKEIAIDRPVAIFSPFGAHAALSMAYLGAGEKTSTADELNKVLELSSLMREPHDVYSELLLNINSADDVMVLLANGIWFNPNATLKEEYQTAVANKYDGIADLFDPSGPTIPINEWVASRTHNKITDLLKPEDIDDSTSAVLLSALYFNGTWQSPFDGKETKKDNFKTDDGSSVEADFMVQQDNFDIKVSTAGGVDVLRLPFGDGRFALYVALPKAADGLSSFEKKIVEDDYDLNQLFAGLSKKRVFVAIPKFKLTSKLDLNKSLVNLGIGSIFSENAALSGISDTPVRITKVRQQVEVEVEERGVIAAAATGYNPDSSLKPARNSYIFKADHPFMYFLRDDVTEMILFQGKQSNPTEVVVEVV